MASLSEQNGAFAVYVLLTDGRRFPIRLGKIGRQRAERLRGFIAELEAAQGSVEPSAATKLWLAGLEGKLRDRLARAGLVQARESMALGQLVDGWLERRGKTLKPGTVVRLQQGKRSLLGYFGVNRGLASVTEGQVEDYRAKLLAEGLAEATVRKRCSDARVWFRYAMRHGYIRSNPFEVVPTAAVATGHLAYLSEPDAQKVLAEIVDPDLRLIFVLSRWGGLRIVSEPKALTWDCVDWEHSRLTVKSPKTERHAGHDQRIIPIFPELAKELQDAFDRAEPGQTYVLPRLQTISSAALRKPMAAAIQRAGVNPWARLWHNLRSSRQTDLEARFPSHVVCAWLGNSATIARKHYLQVLESDYEKATIDGGDKAVRQTVRAGGASDRVEYVDPSGNRIEPQEAAPNKTRMTPTGFEPVLPP